MFAKHQFKYSYKEGCEDFSPVDITFDVPGDASLSQMLYNFQSYLKACGFVFDGELEIVDHTFDVMKDQDDIDEIYGCMADFDKDETIYPSDSDGWCNEEGCGCPKGSKGIEGPIGIKKWNEDIAKLDKEVAKNNWVHGICNPPSPEWKKK